ncbi:2-oxo acid dehydrogenases acyltransferase (catalytic domain) domain-containing protein [Cardiosporidium cionae]|uniref:Dihydrolipoamide acetyltransferase component of pyruvate dehydrogenase complex n=1 Tax=Cardiosporidium cionae TaxID=476202 RepID=A0ABQ7J747_9APIC|nr:2-oxo acid dehydrogenases acyltransferase (catalytic domain) domain-containing protein [Cardiosporidium cionae]|eukprot:KAF8819804.1 2-oxo acid dehydrogenases acyltransferase (catalytic domain) domain-containing protein [Cardiosporidium cionae]
MAPALSRCIAFSRVLHFPVAPAICGSVSNLLSSALIMPSALPPRHLLPFSESRRWLHMSRASQGIVTFNLADIGEGIAEVEVLRWFKNVGDEISEMEEVCEVQSDKAAVEITSRYSGIVTKLHHTVGSIVKIGGPLIDVSVEEDVESQEAVTPAKTQTIASSGADSGVLHPEPDLSAAALLVSFGRDFSLRYTSPFYRGKMGIGSAPIWVALPFKFFRMNLLKDFYGYPCNVLRNIFFTSSQNDVRSSPATRRLAKELGVNLAEVVGTGKDGRISKSDVEEHLTKVKEILSQPMAVIESAAPILPPSSRTALENTEVPIRGFGRTMVKTMSESVKVPHLHIGEEIDITNLLIMRKSMKAVAEKEYGLKLTITPLLIKAISYALLKFPILNSKIDPSGEKYTLFGSHNISIAMDAPNGLIVPNIKNVQDLSILQIQSELSRLQSLAQKNKLSNTDLVGGTISLSNVGIIGGTLVKALLFDGQAMIIAVGKTQRLPRFDSEDDLVARDIVNLGFSADHRHCDGATVARFSAEMKSYLENPELLLMGLR